MGLKGRKNPCSRCENFEDKTKPSDFFNCCRHQTFGLYHRTFDVL
jgi:hypothetical protein